MHGGFSIIHTCCICLACGTISSGSPSASKHGEDLLTHPLQRFTEAKHAQCHLVRVY